MEDLINYQIELAKTQMKALRMKARLYKKAPGTNPSPWAASIETELAKAKYSIISMRKELQQHHGIKKNGH